MSAPVAAPAASVSDVELSAGVPALHAADGPQAWLVVRLFTEPVGMIVTAVPEHGVTPAEVLDVITRELGGALAPRLAAAGSGPLGVDGLTTTEPPAFLTGRAELLATAPRITVVVCTRDRPDGLRTTLAGLVDQEYPEFEVLVVDSASTDDRTRLVTEEFAGQLDLRYLRAEVPGLSRARNLGLTRVRTPLVAWLDDDATADRYWLAELARGFATRPDTAAVSGVVVPRTLRLREQVWFEQFGGHSKGRGFTADVFTRDGAQSPLYPLPAFGVGANMAFRTAALREIGGFDEALGAGSRTRAGEDTLAFTEVLERGGTMVYRPSALVRHDHRDSVAALRTQLDGYGTGLTAYYLALLLARPTRLPRLLALLPRAWRDLRGPRVSSIAADFPDELLASNLRAMLRGPDAYLRQRRANRRPG